MPRPSLLPVIICILACLAGAGCASKNYSTSLRPYPHSFDGVQAKFRINHVDTIPPRIFYMSGFTDNEYWAEKVTDGAKADEFQQQLREVLAGKYPGLFSDTPDALPIDVRFTVSEFHKTSTGSSFLAAVSWGIFGIILPLPIVMQYDCAIQITFPDIAMEQSTLFRNRLFTWVSFPSPLALIPVPAPADRRACGMHPFQTKYYSGRLFTLECFGEAVVQAIEKIDKKRLNEAYQNRCAAKAAEPAR
jgi:hypothetical protein